MDKRFNQIRQSKRKGGERGMRKILLSVLVIMVSVAMSYSFAFAIAGQCSNCHTMHNSQDGSPVDTAGPHTQLLKFDCVSCHTAATTQTNPSTGAPAVLHTTAPSGQGAGKTNAGGDFYWVVNTGDAYGHNVLDLGVSADAAIGVTPPGWDQSATTGLTFNGKTLQVTGGADWSGKQLTCAGTFGCHGYRDQEGFGGLTGAHHGNTGGTSTQASAPSTVGDSYRFLAGIKGLEDANWNWNETSSVHNEYYGADDTSNRQADGSTSYANTDTISFFCAECHGNFHSEIDNDSTSGSPWVRHPTDIVLPNSGEYSAYTTYSVEAPVARPTVPASSSATVTPGDSTGDTGAIVMCLSCHRAHGSNQPDLLRWDYSTMIAGGGGSGGCFTCHTTKK